MVIIECQACRARFKLDESRITGKGARIRCRKCGESIIVMKSDMAPPGASPSPEKEAFDLRAVLREPETRIPVSPSEKAGTRFESPIDREQERKPSPPPKMEEPERPAQWERGDFPAEGAEPPTEAVPPPRDEVQPSFDSPLLRQEETSPPPKMEEPEQPAQWEQGDFPAEGAEPHAGPAPPPRDEVADAFEALLHRDRAQEILPEEPALPEQSPDTPFPTGTEDGEDLIVFRAAGEETGRALYGEEDRKIPGDPRQGEEGLELRREPGQDLTLDLPGFLRKEQPSGTPAGPFDISEKLREAPIEIPEEDTIRDPVTTDPPVHPADPSLSRADAIQDELAGIASDAPIEEPAGPESPPPDMPPPRLQERERVEVTIPRRSAPSGKPSIALLALLFVTLAGGGAYLAFTKTGQETLRSIVPGMEALWLGGKESANPYHVANLIGYYETGDKAGKMFIIKGVATNQGRTKKSGIRIHAELLDGSNQRIAERTVYAGNVLAGLRTATREKIEAAMGNRFGDRLSNVDVAPGTSIPFMVAFFDPPDGIEEYRLEALDGD